MAREVGWQSNVTTCTLLLFWGAFLLLFPIPGSSGFSLPHNSASRPLRSKRDSVMNVVVLRRATMRDSGSCRRSHSVLEASKDGESSPPLSSTSNNDASLADEERRKGILVLMTVPFAWGTFEPVVRFVYAIDPPIPGLVFSPLYYFVAATALSFLSMISSQTKEASNNNATQSFDPDKSPDLSVLGGMELGFYLFVGNSLQVLGLNTLNSDRVAFLIQLTTIFVPLVQAIAARDIFSITARVWVASFIALGGVSVMGFEGKEDTILHINPQNYRTELMDMFTWQDLISQGDILVIGAAICYTFHCIRLEPIAKQTKAVTLAAIKATTETLLSILFLLGLLMYQNCNGVATANDNYLVNFALESAADISTFFMTISKQFSEGFIPTSVLLPALAACLWTGTITCGYTIYAQSYGQSRVSPADANLIYTFQPVWTSLIAFLLLGETLGPAGFIGGSLIGLAIYLVISADQQHSPMEASDDVRKGTKM